MSDSPFAGYRSLTTWQRAMDLVDMVYDASEGWPRREDFGLTSQVRRAVVSVACNVAEGAGRSGKKEYAHHVSIAHGSLFETETLVTIARRRKFIDPASEEKLLRASAEVGRLLNGLFRSLQ
jgi:four helix bundle protein